MARSDVIVLPEALRLARKASGMSQVELAHAAGISVGYIAMIELGQRRPTQRVVHTLASALGVPPSTFAVLPSSTEAGEEAGDKAGEVGDKAEKEPA